MDELLYGCGSVCVVDSLLCGSADCGLISLWCSVYPVVMMSMQPLSQFSVSPLVWGCCSGVVSFVAIYVEMIRNIDMRGRW